MMNSISSCLMRLSSDGFIRVSIDELLSMPIVHLMSGIDVEEGLPTSACGRQTTISGYTEWVTRTEPAITIGWDWCLVTGAHDARFRRVGQPRTNVMVVNEAGEDVPWAQNLEYLGTVVDVLPCAELLPHSLER
jgi:hypothetical protein